VESEGRQIKQYERKRKRKKKVFTVLNMYSTKEKEKKVFNFQKTNNKNLFKHHAPFR
jgi:hypothetical protein